MHKANTRTHTHTYLCRHTLRSSASGFGCPSSNSLCLISSSSSFSLFLSRSSASISFSRSLRRFCSALPLEVTPKITAFRTIARAAVLHLLQVRSGSRSIKLDFRFQFATFIKNSQHVWHGRICDVINITHLQIQARERLHVGCKSCLRI